MLALTHPLAESCTPAPASLPRPDLQPARVADVLRERLPPLNLTRQGSRPLGPTLRVAPPIGFPNVPAMVAAWRPDEPVFCLRPDELRRQAAAFTSGFGGTPLYAVKCNPDPFVLTTLFEAGITGFDVASIEEVERVSDVLGDGAGLFFNNPAKSREAIRLSHAVHGVRFFTVDHPSEFDKLVEETRGVASDISVVVRVAAHAPAARYALSSKFGAPADLAVDLLAAARRAGFRTGLSFHVGSQCLDPAAFGKALGICRDVMRRAATDIDLLNMGGGFPVAYPGDAAADLAAYFHAAELGRRALGLSPDCLILCEPGRALVGTAASVVTRVLMRKGDVLYCNDGIYGNLQELRSPKERRPARVIDREGRIREGRAAFRIYGPTCDSDDVLGASLLLPDDVGEGDWIELGMMGAYSAATRTPFNGFSAHATIQVPG